jgi:hypothetical protein
MALRPQTVESFADVVRESIRTFSHDARNCNDFAAAMYVEQNQKAKRANTFIISGLQEDEQIPDDKLTENLCCGEFGLAIKLSSCKRIDRQLLAKPRNVLSISDYKPRQRLISSHLRNFENRANYTVRTRITRLRRTAKLDGKT